MESLANILIDAPLDKSKNDRMRRFAKILILFLCLWVLTAQSVPAMDALLGEVVSIDPENRQMVVSVEQHGVIDGSRQVNVFYDQQRLPGFVQPGSVVRLWGDYADGNNRVFRLQSLRNGESLHHGHDCTGVRSRLKQGHRGHGMGRSHGGGRH